MKDKVAGFSNELYELVMESQNMLPFSNYTK